MNNELVVFTHNDLDALGCMLNIEYKFPNVIKHYYHTNYANIDSIVDDILKDRGDRDKIIIPDVSFSDNKPALQRLYDNFSTIIHIDHHMYPDGFWDDFPNMRVVYDKTKCAALLCNEFFGNVGKNPSLDKITSLINVYDIWKDDHPKFGVAQLFNEYMWFVGLKNTMHKIISREYGLPIDFINVTSHIEKTYTDEIASFEQRKLINRSKYITFAFVDNWFNQVMINEMKDGRWFVIGINPYGIIRVRINKNADVSEQKLKNIRYKLTGKHELGHLLAFTYKVNGNLNDLIAEAQKINEVIAGECNA